MARFYVPLDVNYQLDDKIMSVGVLAEALYVRALAYSKRAGTEGRIPRATLRALGVGMRQVHVHAGALVEIGLWTQDGDNYHIVGWLNHNLSNHALTEQKAKKRALSIAGNHKRHHVARGVTDDDCELCNPPVGEPPTVPPPSRTGTQIVAREDEQKTNRREDEDEQKRKESSSSPSELHSDPSRPEDEEDEDLISAAMTLVADRLTARNSNGDAFSYRRKVLTDQTRINDLRHLHEQHPDFNAEQLAALHGGMTLAFAARMTEPEPPEPPWPPVSTYTPPPEPEIVPYCDGCDKPAALMRLIGCKNPDPPAGCVYVGATVHHIRPETA